ncbi:MAG TPA: LTA synthase family protein [Stellaceae bacterium]|nr:LTA synthase family protein [Stellaceae bacterium]
MYEFWQCGAGFALAVFGWLQPRWVASARQLGWATLLDAAPLGIVVLLLVIATGRPIFAGAVAFALGGGFAFADRTVRDTLREPVLFSALSELPQIFTHPHLYLPFAGTGLVIGGAGVAAFAGLALLVAEPALATPHPLAAFLAFGLVAYLLRRLGGEPWLGRAARVLRRLNPSGEPFGDAARLGPVAILLVYGMIARAERAARQASLAPRLTVVTSSQARPIILVQCESFFDARRALPALPGGFLAGYDAARAGGAYSNLAVPAWGANSTRAEFAVLSGIAEAALGYDRYNPYHALTRIPIASQVWRLRAAGYRTLCLHPFDRGFYRRDVAMPALGFDEFLCRDTLGGSRTPPYMSDPDLARHILRLLDEAGPRCFIFAITIGNHGPWLHKGDEMECYLDGLAQSDAMLRLLIEGLEQRRTDAVLGFYGDHLPSLPRSFAPLGFDDWRSDYVIWTRGGEPARQDLAAHELGRLVVDLALSPRKPALRGETVGLASAAD